MAGFLFSSLRFRLILLVLLAVLPALGLILYTASEQRRLATTQAQEDARRLAWFAAADQDNLVEGARQLLIALARLPEIRLRQSAGCNARLADLLKQYRRYEAFFAIGPDGYSFCSAPSVPSPIYAGDRLYFQRVIQTGHFAVGEYQVSRATGTPNLVLSHPVLDDTGQVQAVVSVSLDLSVFNKLAAEARLPPGSTFTAIDSRGVILARSPNPEQWVGKSGPEASIIQTILTQREGVGEALDVDGVLRLHAFTPLRGTAKAGDIYLSVGILKEAAFGEANRILRRNLVGLGLVSVLVLIAAWIGSDLFILRRVRALVSATQRLASGDLSARTGLPYGIGEVNQLSRAFDNMAESLQMGQAEAKRAQEALREREARLRVLVEQMPAVLWSTDPALRLTSSLGAGLAGLDPRPNKVVGMTLLDYFQTSDPEFMPIAAHRQALQGDPVTYEMEWMGRTLQAHVEALRDPDGAITGTIGIAFDITERKRAEQALRESQARYHSLFEGVPLGLFRTTPAGQILDVNPALVEMLGYPDRESLLAVNAIDFYANPEDRRRWRVLMEPDRVVRDFEVQFRRYDGKIIWVRNTARTVRDAHGGILCYEGTNEDITERKRAEEALREAELEYRRLVESVQAIVWRGDAQTFQFSFVSKEAETLLGYPVQRWTTEPTFWRDHIHPDDRDWAVSFCARATEEKRSHEFEYRMIAADGRIVWLRDIVRVVVENDRAKELIGVMVDITARRWAEEAERESEKRVRSRQAVLVELARHKALHLGDINAAFRAITEAAARCLGVERVSIWFYNGDRSKIQCLDLCELSLHRHSGGAELTAMNYPRYFEALEEDRAIAAHDAFTDPRTTEFSASYLSPLGITSMLDAPIRLGGRTVGVVCHEHVGPPRQWTLEDENFAGSIADMVSLAIEASERKRAEEELRARARQQAAVAELGRRAIAGTDLAALMNDAVGLLAQTLEVEYAKVLELLPDGTALRLRAGVGWQEGFVGHATVGAGSDSQAGYTLLSGEPVIVEDLRTETRFHGPPLLHEHGVVSGMSVIIPGQDRPFGVLGAHTTRRRTFTQDDVHFLEAVANVLAEAIARKQAEEALRRSEKLAAMGELLAGVAHELNNPLAVIVGQMGLLRQTVREAPVAERLDKVAQATDRCARIVKNFLALAYPHAAERRRVGLNQIVQEAVDLLAYELRVDTVEVRLDLAPDLPVLWADPHQLQQVVVNLVTNAHQVMREISRARRLTLTTRFQPTTARVALEVADTGPGIPEEIRSRIFEPFFTTKPPGRGTGLGLSLCQGIIEGHGGTIDVESTVGQGTVFRIELPVEESVASKPEIREAEALPRIRGKTILVVDDEAGVTAVLVELLSYDAHHVETAANGSLALAKLDERTYDLILSDIRMPELDGPAFYREVARRHPKLSRRIIFISGDSVSPETRDFLAETGAPSLDKPFVLEEVRQIVQQILLAPPTL